MKLATLAIIVKDGRVLLGYKKKGEIGTGTLNGPGGKCDGDESPLVCVIRETKEELDVTLFADELELVAIITFFAAEKADFMVHIFRTEYFEGEPKETADMIPGWYPIEELPFDRMHDSDKKWFARATQGERFRANVYYRKRAVDFDRIEFFPLETA